MKKILALVLAALMVLSLAGCAAGNKADDGKFNVAIVLGVGGLGDESFNDSMYDGCKMAMEADENVVVQVVEPTEVAEFEGHFIELSKSKKYDLIIGSGFDGVEPMQKVAANFPEQKYLFVDGDCGDMANVTSVTFRDNEKAFLLGYLTAKTTAADKLGFVGGMDIPSINMFAAGFESGAAYANKAITVERKYVGAWNDSTTGKELALALYDGGCDTVYAAAGGSGLGVFTAAQEKGTYVIGADVNQCPIAPDHVVVSGLRTLNYIIRDNIFAARDGKLVAGTVSAGLKENGVDIIREGSNVVVDEAILAEVEQVKADIIAGKIVVPDNLDDSAAFIAALA